jgi:group I intron endonuclease
MVLIYKITNLINGKIYIGQTCRSIKSRFNKHKSASRAGGGYVIGKAMRKYGEDKFIIETIDECQKDNANEREIFWISKYDSTNYKIGYNESIGGNVTWRAKEYSLDQILEHFNKGIPVYKIARILHTDIPNLTKVLKLNNIKYGSEKQRISQDVVNQIMVKYKSGVGVNQLSRELNIDRHTTRKYLNRILSQERFTPDSCMNGENVL